MKKWRPSFWMFVLAIAWFVGENRYFGWNWTAQSGAELLADFGVYVLLALAFMARSNEGPQ